MLTSDPVDPLLDDDQITSKQSKQSLPASTTRIGAGLLNSIIKEANSHEETKKPRKREEDAQRRALAKLENAFDQKFPLLASLDCIQLTSVWAALLDHVKVCLVHIFSQALSSSPTSPLGASSGVENLANDQVQAMIELHDMSSLMIRMLNHPQHQVCKEAVEIVQMLHAILLYLDAESVVGAKLQDKVAQLCEAWYSADLLDCEQIVPQTVLYLLLKTAGPLASGNGTFLI